ncbi:MAG: hypothetical protein ABIP64_05105 [Burkholderiales bacterium]
MFRTSVGALALALSFSATAAYGQVGFGGMLPGPGTTHTTGSGGSYSGPGDLKAYDIWVGTYAYSAATRGTAAVNVCNAGDANCADLNTDTTTGLLAVSATNVGASPCNDSTNICTIKIWYNQGTGGSSYDFPIAAAFGARATLLVSCGGLTSAACGSSTSAAYETTAANYAVSQPYTVTVVSYRNASVAAGMKEMNVSGVLLGAGFFGALNDSMCDAGSLINPSATDAVWHGKACSVNGASSNFTIDTTNTAGNAGSNATTGHVFFWDQVGVGSPWQGRIASLGIENAAFNTTELAAANAASKTILGY